MFGNGLYFSDQSTKSLNYSYGYWNGVREPNCFMFIADVAMGNASTPSGPTRNNPPAGHDSYFAQANKSGVQNNEMIVFRTSQVQLRWLIEFA
jgi:poly [ADP-ribose] polymerase 2/3/4